MAFSCALLSGNVKGGIWFPEEAIETKEDIAAVLGLAGIGAHTLEVGGGMKKSDVWG